MVKIKCANISCARKRLCENFPMYGTLRSHVQTHHSPMYTHACMHTPTHTDTDKHSDHFILCKVPQAVYADHFLHKCVTVPLAALPGNHTIAVNYIDITEYDRTSTTWPQLD